MEDNGNDEMRAYKILMERHINDDRLMNERMSVFLLANSFLFAGFVVLIKVEQVSYLRLIVPVVGIIMCIAGFILSWRTMQGLCFWDEAESKINTYGDCFKYMRRREICPDLVYKHIERAKSGGWLWGRKCFRSRNIYTYCFPLLFLMLWSVSLYWAYYHSA